MSSLITRPQRLGDLVGLEGPKETLQRIVDAHRRGISTSIGYPTPNILFYGAPGTGKTTLAEAFARDLELPFFKTVGGEISTVERLWRFCEEMAPALREAGGAVAFIDEIHAVGSDALASEVWLPLLEDRVLYHGMKGRMFSVIHGPEGERENSVRLLCSADVRTHLKNGWDVFEIQSDVGRYPGVCWIGATTDPDRCSAAIRRRFALKVLTPEYTEVELVEIVRRAWEETAPHVLPGEVPQLIATRSRRNPSEALNLLESLLPYVLTYVRADVPFPVWEAAQILERQGAGAEGLRREDKEALEYLADHGPMGVSAVGAFLSSMGISKRTFEETVEPWLMREGLITRSTRGREVTEKGRRVIGR